MGHSYQSSGMAHLFKVLLALQNEVIPGTLNVTRPLATNETGKVRFAVGDRSVAWKRGGPIPRRAAISSFGATGSNVHLVLSEAPADHAGGRNPIPPGALALKRCWLDRPAIETVTPPAVVSGGVEGVLSVVIACLAEITGFDAQDIEPKDSLNHYGLDSLMAMRLLARLNDHFSLTIHIADLVSVDSIDDLARLIRECQAQTLSPQRSELFGFGQGDHEIRIPGSWFASRLKALPETLNFVNTRIASGSPSGPNSSPRMLSELLDRGIGAFRLGPDVVLVGHPTSDLRAAATQIDAASLSALPEACLLLPVSDEQRRNLFHSETMKSAAWNVSYVETPFGGVLDRAAFLRALAKMGDRHDILRTRFVSLETEQGWLQVIGPPGTAALDFTEAGSAQEFNRLMREARSRLFDVEGAPPFAVVICQSNSLIDVGFTLHHAIADAFTPPLLMRELAGLYAEEVAAGSGTLEAPPIGQYWHYALSQSSHQPAMVKR